MTSWTFWSSENYDEPGHLADWRCDTNFILALRRQSGMIVHGIRLSLEDLQ